MSHPRFAGRHALHRRPLNHSEGCEGEAKRVDRCARGKKKVEQLEATLATASRDRMLNETAYRNSCGSLLASDQADCAALLPKYRARRFPSPPPTSPSMARTEVELEQARDELRKAQLEGR